MIDLSGKKLGGNGLLLIGSQTVFTNIPTATATLLDTRFNSAAGVIENGTNSLLLISSPVPIKEATDYDTNDDGSLDLPLGASTQDAVGWTDNGKGDKIYGGVELSQLGVPDAATRFIDNSTPFSVVGWYNGDLIDASTYNSQQASANLPAGAALTPGAPNALLSNQVIPSCPNSVVTPAGTAKAIEVSAFDSGGKVNQIAITSNVRAGITLSSVLPATTPGGTAKATLNVAASTTAGNDGVTITFTNTGNNRSASCRFNVTVTSPGGPFIHDIQGASQNSPLVDTRVQNIPGVVIATTTSGFYMQDPDHDDGNPATSEGVFVRTQGAKLSSPVTVGASVRVDGLVTEVRPGGTGGTNNLSTTTISLTQALGDDGVSATPGATLPAPTIIGTGGRVPPQQVIDDDVSGDAQTTGTFDPGTDGLDFYESLEGMLVQVNNPVVVGPTSVFSGGTASENREVVVLGDDGANAVTRSARGGIVAAANDFNPERIFLSDTLARPSGVLPLVNVGDHFTGAITGTIDYSFGNFKLDVLKAPTATSGNLVREVTAAASQNQVSVATFNLENLDPTDPQTKFDQLAGLIVTNLQAPDILAVEEIQDNNGPTNNGTVDASATYTQLVAAIVAKGGPAYQFRDIAPVNNQDGGEPGGNIRQGFLFRTDRGLAFVDRAGGSSTSAVTVTGQLGNPELSASPGRIDPTNAAFANSRKPLAGEFTYGNAKLFVIANHFNSKSGDLPLFGRVQPPTRVSEAQRAQQAQVVGGFVGSILSRDPNANVVVLGDLNDFEFSGTLAILKASGLTDLVETLPQSERYTYVFEGNSETLDHILVSSHLTTSAAANYDVVHVNAEFADQASDHDPQVVRLSPPSPTLALSGPATVSEEAGTATISVTLSSAAVVTTSVDYSVTSDAAITLNKVIASGTLTFGPGETTKAVTVPLTDVKPGEKLTLTLSNPKGASLSSNASITLTVVEKPAAQFKIFLPIVRK